MAIKKTVIELEARVGKAIKDLMRSKVCTKK